VLWETCDEIESTYRSFTAANEDSDLANFCKQYFSSLQYLPVDEFRSRVEKWVTEENVNLFNPTPLDVVTRRLCNPSIGPIEFHQWKDIACYLIAKNAKFYEFQSRYTKACLLTVAITSVAQPFDAQTIGTRLLEMLDASNVDLAEYLTFERQHHPEGLLAPEIQRFIRKEPWFVSSDPRAIKLCIHEEQPFLLSWDWWVDPKETAFTVLHEFRHFGQAGYFSYGQLWLAGGLIYWPFIYPKWMFGLNAWAKEEEEALLKRFQQRSEYRWQKKMIKQAKIQGTYKKPKMPGTWID
jgi:hypothetical protein